MSTDEVQKYPRVQAHVKSQKMMIAVDKSIVVLENENNVECRFLSVDALIDCFAMSQSGEITICGLAGGRVIGIFIRGIPF